MKPLLAIAGLFPKLALPIGRADLRLGLAEVPKNHNAREAGRTYGGACALMLALIFTVLQLMQNRGGQKMRTQLQKALPQRLRRALSVYVKAQRALERLRKMQAGEFSPRARRKTAARTVIILGGNFTFDWREANTSLPYDIRATSAHYIAARADYLIAKARREMTADPAHINAHICAKTYRFVARADHSHTLGQIWPPIKAVAFGRAAAPEKEIKPQETFPEEIKPKETFPEEIFREKTLPEETLSSAARRFNRSKTRLENNCLENDCLENNCLENNCLENGYHQNWRGAPHPRQGGP